MSKSETSAYIQSLSLPELKALFANGTPVIMNWAVDENPEQLAKIYDIMDLTELEYADVECLLYTPHKARLCDIQTYCHALNIDVLAFIQKVLTVPTVSVATKQEEGVLV